MIERKTYKLEYADKEYNFLSEYTFEAANDFEAQYITDHIIGRYKGNKRKILTKFFLFRVIQSRPDNPRMVKHKRKGNI